MYTFSTTKQIESKVAPGVTFTIRTFTDAVRSALRLGVAEVLAQMRELQAEQEELDKEAGQDSEAPKFKRLAREVSIVDKLGLLSATQIDPAYFNAGFVKIEGIEVDGVALSEGSYEKLGKQLPEKLMKEIVFAIRDESGLNEAEKENLESPTTSAAVVDGQSPASIAATASETNSTTLETAPSISPAT